MFADGEIFYCKKLLHERRVLTKDGKTSNDL
jgi:hypothetical protein